MSEMTNPMNALIQLQFALDSRLVFLTPCEIHKDISVIMDEPNGGLRLTYARTSNGKVQSISIFALTESVEGVPCFQMGWATIESMRGKGLATEIVTKSIDEIRNGLRRQGAKKFYIEAVISTSNVPSNKIAKKLLSDCPVSCDDAFSGESALQYLRIIE